MKKFLCFLFCLIAVSFYLSEDTLLYYSTGLSRGVQSVIGSTIGDTYLSTSWDEPPIPSDSSQVSTPIYNGILGMYTSKMASNIYKEYLDIAVNHCNWSMIHPNVSRVRDSDGNLITMSVASILGLANCESGRSRYHPYLPVQMINPDLYAFGDQRYSLSTFNSRVIQENSKALDTAVFRSDLSIKVGGGYRSPYQFYKTYMAIYPYESYGGKFYPSLMNGYGVQSGRVRGVSESDAAYLPDCLSLVIEHGLVTASRYCNIDKLDDGVLDLFVYSVHNGGAGMMATIGIGRQPTAGQAGGNTKFTNGGAWEDLSGATTTEATSMAMNQIGAVVAKVREYLSTYGGNPINDYGSIFEGQFHRGLFTVSMLENGGFFATQDAKATVLKQANKSLAFRQGMELGFRVFKVITADCITYIDSHAVQTVDTGFYGKLYTGKGSSADFTIHRYNESMRVYNNDGQGTRPILQCYPAEACGGVFNSSITGDLMYWQILNLCGVEVSYADAVKDGRGTYIPEKVQEVVSTGATYLNGGKKLASPFENSAQVNAITSTMSYRAFDVSPGVHYGEDFRAKVGDKLYSMCTGVVEVAEYNKWRGNYIKVRFTDVGSKETSWYIYQHMTDIAVKVGDKVEEGTYVGTAGKTGNVTGAHLHLELLSTRTLATGESMTLHFQFKSIYEGLYNMETGVGCITGSKSPSYPGKVYNAKLEHVGTLADLPHLNGVSDYYNQGPNHWR